MSIGYLIVGFAVGAVGALLILASGAGVLAGIGALSAIGTMAGLLAVLLGANCPEHDEAAF